MTGNNGWQWFAFGSAFFAGMTAILGKVGVTEINSNLATLIRTVVILGVSALMVTACGEWKPLNELWRPGLLFLIFSGIATGLSWLCYFRALQLAPASLVAPIDKLSVAFVMVFAWILLGEPLSFKIWLGGALIVIGAAVLAT